MPIVCYPSLWCPGAVWHAVNWTACSLVVLNLAACGGGSGNGVSTNAPPTAPSTLEAQIAQLESSGALPALDRSISIAGPDVNGNGVRDDIEYYITRLPLTAVQQRAALQDAKAAQMTLTVDLTDKVALQRVGDAGMASMKCLSKNFSDSRSEMSSRIESMTANTRERAQRYMAYNAARSGSSTSWPRGDTCE
jgi:hypothetical protein